MLLAEATDLATSFMVSGFNKSFAFAVFRTHFGHCARFLNHTCGRPGFFLQHLNTQLTSFRVVNKVLF